MTTFPYAYGTHLGIALTSSDRNKRDPLMLAVSFVGVASSIAIAWKVGVIAKTMLRERAFYGEMKMGADDKLADDME